MSTQYSSIGYRYIAMRGSCERLIGVGLRYELLKKNLMSNVYIRKNNNLYLDRQKEYIYIDMIPYEGWLILQYKNKYQYNTTRLLGRPFCYT